MYNPWDLLYYALGWSLLVVLVIALACGLWLFLVLVVDSVREERELHVRDMESIKLANEGYRG